MDETLTIKNYKEPLLKIEKGFGYYGAISITTDGAKIQCHICGKLFEGLSMHVYQTHHLKADEYRAKFNLSRSTALISEKFREQLKERTLEWLRRQTPEEKAAFRRKAIALSRKYYRENKDKIVQFRWNIRLETKNKRGTCPDQLLEKIKEVSKKLGHVPSLVEFIAETGGQRYKHLIFKVFGSWKNALGVLKMKVREGSTGRGLKKKQYSNEELLEYLLLYAQENRKVPTASDCRRSIIPTCDTYIRRFGSFEEARVQAGVYNFVSRNSLRGSKS